MTQDGAPTPGFNDALLQACDIFFVSEALLDSELKAVDELCSKGISRWWCATRADLIAIRFTQTHMETDNAVPSGNGSVALA